MRKCSLAVGLLFVVAGAASAQTTTPQILTDQPPLTYDVKTMTFDRWCQETQRYAVDRCEKRLPADVTAFESYRDVIERYELQYLKQTEQNQQAQRRGNQDPTQTERARQDAPTPAQ